MHPKSKETGFLFCCFVLLSGYFVSPLVILVSAQYLSQPPRAGVGELLPAHLPLFCPVTAVILHCSFICSRSGGEQN